MAQRVARDISIAERETCQRITKVFSELTTYRNVSAGQWEEAAILVDPDSRNTFYYGSYNFPGMKKTQQQVDATTALALQQFCAIADSMITPKNRRWHGLESDEYVMKDRATRKWFDCVREILFDYRYRPEGNFVGENFRKWKSTGAYGNSVVYIDCLDMRWTGGRPGLRYHTCPLGECFFAENHQGVVTTLVRWFRLTAQQALEKFGEEWVPAQLWPALEQNLQTPYQFLHCVMPRDPNEFDPRRLDAKGKPYSSHYMSIEGQCLMAEEGGYRVFPYAVSRYDQMPNEVYGRGPLQLALPGVKTLNAQKGVFLKTGHRASDPVYLTGDDGIVGFDQTPGAMNKGAVNSDGKPMVLTLPVGDVHITLEMMQEERGIIENFFLTPLFKTLMQNPNMTATQVVELINERAMLVAPTLGRQHSEYVGTLVQRELDLLRHMSVGGRPVIPQMPPRLREAGGYYEVTDTSPLALQARGASRQAAAMRIVDQLRQLAADTQNPAVVDRVNVDNMAEDWMMDSDLPVRWINTDQQMAVIRKQRAQGQQRQMQIQAMPAQAAMIKANAVAAKNGPPPGAQPQLPQQQPEQPAL